MLKIEDSQTLYSSRARTAVGASKMRKSKLEACEEILGILSKEASTIDRLSYETNMNISMARDILRFLIKNGLVEERKLNKSTKLNAITERGAGVLKALNFQKDVVKIRTSISALDEAM